MLRVFAYIKCAAYSAVTPDALNSPRYQPKSGQQIQRSAAGHGLLHCLPQTLRLRRNTTLVANLPISSCVERRDSNPPHRIKPRT